MSSAKNTVKYTLIAFIWAFIPHVIKAEPYTTVVDHGDPANRLDIAIMGDGYTSTQLDKYRSDV
jgi:hypothetical protein